MSRSFTIPKNYDEQSLCQDLMELQVQRRFCIRSQIRCDNAIESLIARAIDYSPELPENDRRKIFKTARAIRLKFEKDANEGRPGSDPRIPLDLGNMIETSFTSRAQWDRQRISIESGMMELARLLRVWPWVKSVSGVAELGLAVIVGETGNIANYSGPAKLWKRLGLACMDGSRQGQVPKELVGQERKDAWKLRGYNPHRRAEIWSFIDDIMFRQQWRADRDEDGKNPKLTGKSVVVPAHPIGPYGQVYGDRKEWNLARGLSPVHAEADARRIMTKRFIRDFWIAWHTAVGLINNVEAAE